MGNVRHFRRIHEIDARFLKMCDFRGNLVNYWEIYKFYPWSTLRHFRRIRKNDALFLKMYVFREQIAIFQSIAENGTMASSQNVT